MGISNTNPILLAFIGGLFTWGVTALGASMVFFFKHINQRILNIIIGFAGGIMIAASFWSLLLPALDKTKELNMNCLAIILGFSSGGLFLYLSDKFLPLIGWQNKISNDNLKENWKKCVLLVTAITIHNIPEGLAFGVAFGLVGTNPVAFAAAVTLTLGIGIQNFPEGAAVSIPLRKEGFSRTKSFLYGQFSGIVEPISAVFGAWLAISVESILPFALAFAAGAMIFVVVEELIPESQNNTNDHTGTFGLMLGFVVMTLLDIVLG